MVPAILFNSVFDSINFILAIEPFADAFQTIRTEKGFMDRSNKVYDPVV